MGDFSQQTVTYYQRVRYGIQGLTNVEYVPTNKTVLGGIIKNHGDCSYEQQIQGKR